MTERRLRVLIADDNESVRKIVRQLLKPETDIEVVAEALDGHDVIQKAREQSPDVVLLDISMPEMNGLEAARILRQEFPSMHIVIVSQHDSRGFQWAALAAGVSGYLVKSDAARDLVPELLKIRHTRLSA